jgi:GMP synthase (glutamine-hydrolysing)
VRPDRGDEIPTRLGQASGLIVMGGPMGVYETERYPWIKDELRLLRRALDHDAPVLAICLGAELLAAALGADVRRSDEAEIGWFPVELADQAANDPLFGAAPKSFTALHWHGDIFDLPPAATHLAHSEKTRQQAFRTGRAWGLLFHLEADAAHVSAMTQAFSSDLAAAGVDAAALVERSYPGADALAPIADGVFSRWAELCRR